MRRFFSYFFSLLFVVIIVLIVIGFITWMRIPGILSKNLSDNLQVEVRIGDASLGWNQISIASLFIGNPPGSILPKAFSCDRINIDNTLPNYLKDDVVVELIHLQDIYLGLEFESPTGAKGNWTKIMGNLERSQTKHKKDKKVSSRTVLIRKIILENIKVDVVYATQPNNIKHLPTIDRLEFTDISSEGGFPTDQIMNSVLGQTLKSIFVKENLQNMLNDLLDPSKNPVESLLKPFKGLFNTNEEPVKDFAA